MIDNALYKISGLPIRDYKIVRTMLPALPPCSLIARIFWYLLEDDNPLTCSSGEASLLRVSYRILIIIIS